MYLTFFCEVMCVRCVYVCRLQVSIAATFAQDSIICKYRYTCKSIFVHFKGVLQYSFWHAYAGQAACPSSLTNVGARFGRI